jgi:hypothetical protein
MFREAARHPVEGSGAVDARLCHGSAALLNIFNRFFQATGEAVFADAAHTWLERTLALKTPGQGIGGYAAWSRGGHADVGGQARPDGGHGGVALALLVASPVEPTWDRVLLMSLRE